MVRTAGKDPTSLAQALRREVSRVRPDFRVSNVATQMELVQSHTIRERLLAMLSMFFASVALLLAGVGLYGVLHYSVLQRRRELSIRIALGARAGNLARGVTTEVFGMLLLGSLAGLAAGMAAESSIETVLFGVKATDWRMAAIPALTIFVTALLAALPPVLRAVRIDPALALRSE
jgi:ABC-type antimicrobial peptide transport system permease subunit